MEETKQVAQSHKRMEAIVKEYSFYVGLDVHAESVSVAIAEAGRGEVRFIGTLPNDGAVIVKALRKLGDLGRVKACYEAGPCGYGLYWALTEAGVDCDVVAPTLIPVRAGDRVKTDRRDAEKLARLLRSGELTSVWVPDGAHEGLRDLVRARVACKRDQRRARQRLQKFLLRHGLHAPLTGVGRKRVSAFGVKYMKWIKSISMEHKGAQLTFEDYVSEVAHQTERLSRLEQQISVAIESAPEKLRTVVKSLQALHGIAATNAATLVMEIGDFSRFNKPTKLMAYAGLVPREHSSGGPGKSSRGSITKTGNAYVRHALVESAWSYRHRKNASEVVRKRRVGLPANTVRIAEKAQQRLTARYFHMRQTDKAANKVTTAIARELLGFVWAIAVETEESVKDKPGKKAA